MLSSCLPLQARVTRAKHGDLLLTGTFFLYPSAISLTDAQALAALAGRPYADHPEPYQAVDLHSTRVYRLLVNILAAQPGAGSSPSHLYRESAKSAAAVVGRRASQAGRQWPEGTRDSFQGQTFDGNPRPPRPPVLPPRRHFGSLAPIPRDLFRDRSRGSWKTREEMGSMGEDNGGPGDAAHNSGIT